MIPLHTRAICDICGEPAAIEIESGFFLCDAHGAALIESVTSDSSSSGVKATAGAMSPPAPASAVADFFEIESSCGGVEGHAATPSGIADMDGMQTRDGRIVKGAGIKPGPQDSNSDPVLSSPLPLTGPATCGAVSIVEAVPLLSSNTPEASGTARKAPSGSLLGEPSRIPDRASHTFGRVCVGQDFESVVAAIESEWIAQGISLRNSDTLRVTAPSRMASNDISSL